MAKHFNAINAWAVNRERALNTNPVRGDPPDGEVFVDSAAAPANDNAFERLNTLPRALDYPVVHANGIAGAKIRDIVLQEFLFDLPDCVNHGANLPDVSIINLVKQQEAAPRATCGF